MPASSSALSQPAPSSAGSSFRAAQPVPGSSVQIQDRFWTPRRETNARITLSTQYQQLFSSGRLAALGLWTGDGPQPQTHVFYDSDIAKWLEAVAYAHAEQPNQAVWEQASGVIAGYERIQEADGYVNQHFHTVGLAKRFTNLEHDHELYCIGHLIEAAVAWHTACGDDRLLKVMIHCVDFVWQVYGPQGKDGYCGHPEFELALMRLYGVTGNSRHLELCQRQVDLRGQTPNTFLDERKRLKATPPFTMEYFQAHAPVLQQQTCEGHAVRALYLFCGVADLARVTNNEALKSVCDQQWDSVVQRRMYITGGVGSSAHQERITHDFDLPNQAAYTETCAAISMVFFAQRMLQQRPDRQYSDIMECALYNGVMSGLSVDGQHYFYANPLTVEDGYDGMHKQYKNSTYKYQRQQWFGCACCPPNLARLLADLGSYVAMTREQDLYLNLYMGGRVQQQGWDMSLTDTYIAEAKVQITVQAAPSNGTLWLRIPGWSSTSTLTCDGKALPLTLVDGYVACSTLKAGMTLELTCDANARLMYAHPQVAADAGKVAIMRGPLVYCVEACDHQQSLAQLAVASGSELTVNIQDVAGVSVPTVSVLGVADDSTQWGTGLYHSTPAPVRAAEIRAVPYCLWGNREPGAMRVWLRRAVQSV